VGCRPGTDRGWLTGRWSIRDLFTATEEGIPQGGWIMPVAVDVALHGMEHAAGSVTQPSEPTVGHGPRQPDLIRYATTSLLYAHQG